MRWNAGRRRLRRWANSRSREEPLYSKSPVSARTLKRRLSAEGTAISELLEAERRARLEAWYAEHTPARTDISEIVGFDTVAELETLWTGARETGIEGLMLKRRMSPYLAGRPKGHWYKWKRAPLMIDAVLMYAQRGSGKRSSYYSDYTFGCWSGEGGGELLPVGKAYFGFTDEELAWLDRFVRGHTVQRFGPVREVEKSLVLEVAFDSIHQSRRHKSGLAMRFPRVSRIRRDKPAAEADTIAALRKLAT